MRRILILGGGFGGVATVHALREKLAPEDEIIVVDKRSHFMVGFRKTWALTGQSTLDKGLRPLAALEKYGIKLIRGTVTAIDPAGKAVEIAEQGHEHHPHRYEADALVVALGAKLAPDAVPGFSDYALNVYDRANIPTAAQALKDFKGGRVAVGVFGAIYKCPPAPYEIALSVGEFFQEQDTKAEIEVFSPLPLTIPALGADGCAVLDTRLIEEGIVFLPQHQANTVADGGVVFGNGDEREFDMLLGVPPHKLPDVLIESGLSDGKPWIPVHPNTLETRYEDVYAIGDNALVKLANDKRLPMAGLFAELEGKIVAQRIVSKLAGDDSDALFDGIGACFLEVGNGKAVLIEGEFLAEPKPNVIMTDATTEYMDQKREFESERLENWFGE